MRRLALSVKVFRGIHLRLDGGDDGFSDFILYREDIGEPAVVMVPPTADCRLPHR